MNKLLFACALNICLSLLLIQTSHAGALDTAIHARTSASRPGKQSSPTQTSIAAVNRMARLPYPLDVRNWRDVSQQYYDWVLNPSASGDDFPVVTVPSGASGFALKDYVGGPVADEALACLSAVVGAKLVGLDTEHLYGVNYMQRAKAWYDPTIGLYRNRIEDRSPIISSGIYGYWSAVLGMELAAENPHDSEFHSQAVSTADAFLKIAHGLGAPDNPNYNALGWDFTTATPDGRPEPMNRLGNAPAVAWILLIGAKLTGNTDMLRCARATMQWYIEHPGRYEITQAMGPLTAARLNAQGGPQIDMTRVMSAWFGDGDSTTMPWEVTSGTHFGGMTEDALDGAKWPNGGFYAFTMGTLQDPAWLVPVARYDPQYARAIGRYALNAANSARLLEGDGLDADHQDHAAWKEHWDKKDLLFYEGLKSTAPGNHGAGSVDPMQPYATGDPVMYGWNTGHPKIDPNDYLLQRTAWFGNTPDNLALYGGNSVGFLGGIEEPTNVKGILRWDCLATDWFHPAALPTFLYYNPYPEPKHIVLELSKSVDLYDEVANRFIARSPKTGHILTLAPNQAAVIVEVPTSAKIVLREGRLMAGGYVISYLAAPLQVQQRTMTR